MNKILLVGIVVFVIAISAVGLIFAFNYYNEKANPESIEEYKYALVGMKDGVQIEMDFMILNLTGQENLFNIYDIYYEGTTDKLKPKIATINYHLNNPVFLYGKFNECYYSKDFYGGYDENHLFTFDCDSQLKRIGNLNISNSGSLYGGDNMMNLTLASDGHINGPAICIPDWGYNIINVDFPDLTKITNIGNFILLPCYQFREDIVNNSVTTRLHYKAFETDESDYIHLVIVDMDRRIDDEGREVGMFFYNGKDIGMKNIDYVVK